MARNKQNRVIQQPPRIKGLNPMGYYSSGLGKIQLKIEEYEAIRLIDYENLTQEQASSYMKISRPTLTRIYDSARKKLGITLIEAKQLLIEGGNYVFKEVWHQCESCQCKFNIPNNKNTTNCTICGSASIIQMNEI